VILEPIEAFITDGVALTSDPLLVMFTTHHGEEQVGRFERELN